VESNSGAELDPQRTIKCVLCTIQSRRQELIRKSLKTTVFTVAQARLPYHIKAARCSVSSDYAIRNGKMNFGDAAKSYQERLLSNPGLKKRTKSY